MAINEAFFTLYLENVTWVEVQEFIDKLNARQDVVRYRIPTETEWEYTCRAGTYVHRIWLDSVS